MDFDLVQLGLNVASIGSVMAATQVIKVLTAPKYPPKWVKRFFFLVPLILACIVALVRTQPFVWHVYADKAFEMASAAVMLYISQKKARGV